MNHTGVASTGSRRQAFRNLDVRHVQGLNRDAQQLARERHQLLEPERLEAQLGAERPDFVRTVVVEVIVAGDDGDRGGGEAGNRANGAEKLQAARQRHPQIEDDGVRAMGLGQRSALRPPTARPTPRSLPDEAFAKTNPSTLTSSSTISTRGRRRFAEGIRRIVVTSAAGSSRLEVGDPKRGRLVLYSPVFASFLAVSWPLERRIRYVHTSEVVLSPILVRPVREQLEHDRVIRLLQAKYKRKSDSRDQPRQRAERARRADRRPGFRTWCCRRPDKNRRLLGVVEVETTESINHLEAMSAVGGVLASPAAFHLYVPAGSIDSARRLCTDLNVNVAEFWATTRSAIRFASRWCSGPRRLSRRRPRGGRIGGGKARKPEKPKMRKPPAAARPAGRRGAAGCCPHEFVQPPHVLTASGAGPGGAEERGQGQQGTGAARDGGQSAGSKDRVPGAEAPVAVVPFLRVIRDKRGYETTYLMHWYREGNRQRSRILYVFRTPGGVRVGRDPLEPEVLRQIEAHHPEHRIRLEGRPRQPADRRDGPRAAPAAGTAHGRGRSGDAPAPSRGRGTARASPSSHPRPRSRATPGRADRVSRPVVSRDPRADSAADARSAQQEMLLALAERMNPAAWTDADQITTGLQQAAEALERLSHVFAKRRRRGRKKPRGAPRAPEVQRPRRRRDASPTPDATEEPDDSESADADENSSLDELARGRRRAGRAHGAVGRRAVHRRVRGRGGHPRAGVRPDLCGRRDLRIVARDADRVLWRAARRDCGLRAGGAAGARPPHAPPRARRPRRRRSAARSSATRCG